MIPNGSACGFVRWKNADRNALFPYFCGALCTVEHRIDFDERGCRRVERAAERAIDRSDGLKAASDCHFETEELTRRTAQTTRDAFDGCVVSTKYSDRNRNSWRAFTTHKRCVGFHQFVRSNDGNFVCTGKDDDVGDSTRDFCRTARARNDHPTRRDRRDCSKRFDDTRLRRNARATRPCAENLKQNRVMFDAHEAGCTTRARLAISELRDPESAHDGQMTNDHERPSLRLRDVGRCSLSIARFTRRTNERIER
jgi:hypothetical protein